MMKQLSYSQISTYTTCGYKYYLRYEQNYRSQSISSPLIFGSAIDEALNVLLRTRDVFAALLEFEKMWNFQFINKVYTALSQNEYIVYKVADFDADLLTIDDTAKLSAVYPNWLDTYKIIANAKKANIFLDTQQLAFYAYANWLSLFRKGQLMLYAYNSKVMPFIKEVLAVQKEQHMTHEDGAHIIQHVDLIVKWIDDTHILFDNKTSSVPYSDVAAGRSVQLLSYFVGCKEEYALKKVGYLVLNKNIVKNKIKICTVCEHNGSLDKFKTCNNVVAGKRCRGAWNVDMSPECTIQIIINDVEEASETLVSETFVQAHNAIAQQHWYRNLSACEGTYGPCEYVNVCWKKDMAGVVVVN